jgi:hypothetical protein
MILTAKLLKRAEHTYQEWEKLINDQANNLSEWFTEQGCECGPMLCDRSLMSKVYIYGPNGIEFLTIFTMRDMDGQVESQLSVLDNIPQGGQTLRDLMEDWLAINRYEKAEGMPGTYFKVMNPN